MNPTPAQKDMSAKHTPGPWNIGESPKHILIRGQDANNVAMIYKRGNCESNARLIVAAPELKQSVEYLLEMVERFSAGLYSESRTVKDAKAALSKATGGNRA